MPIWFASNTALVSKRTLTTRPCTHFSSATAYLSQPEATVVDYCTLYFGDFDVAAGGASSDLYCTTTGGSPSGRTFAESIAADNDGAICPHGWKLCTTHDTSTKLTSQLTPSMCAFASVAAGVATSTHAKGWSHRRGGTTGPIGAVAAFLSL